MLLITDTVGGCANCPLKAQCTRGEGDGAITHYAIDATKEPLRSKMAQAGQRQNYRRLQTMLAPVFNQLRSRQLLRHFRRKGLCQI